MARRGSRSGSYHDPYIRFLLFATLRARFHIKRLRRRLCRIRRTCSMALLVRLRRALLRSSSIPKCCSFSPIPSDSSHLINLSKTLFSAASRLENPSIRPTPSKHDRRPPSTCSNLFLFRPHYRQLGTKIPKDEIDFPKFPKPSPEEMIETFFQNLAKVLASVEDSKAIEKMSDKSKESGFEMIEQLKGACMREKRSVEDVEVIEEMSDKLRKSGLEMIEQLKGMLGFVSVLPGSDIDNKNNKSEGSHKSAWMCSTRRLLSLMD